MMKDRTSSHGSMWFAFRGALSIVSYVHESRGNGGGGYSHDLCVDVGVGGLDRMELA